MASITYFIEKQAEYFQFDSIGTTSAHRFLSLQKQHIPEWKNGINEVFPAARGIISAAFSYRHVDNLQDSTSAGYIARYTTAGYYRIVRKKLEQLAKMLWEQYIPDQPFKQTFKVQVNSRIHDKLAAWACGIGYIGSNSLIHIPGMGPMYILGTILTTIPLPDSPIITISCGNCRLCVSSCPTGALGADGSLDKSICLHHLSSVMEWPETINGRNMIEWWGSRFFGCSDCIDCCPDNTSNLWTFNDFREAVGYIGTIVNPVDILAIQKDDIKRRFHHNQLAAGWIPEITLVRNSLAALFNLGKKDLIKEYSENVKNLGWGQSEIKYIHNFINFLLTK